jgi:hypothetical protein
VCKNTPIESLNVPAGQASQAEEPASRKLTLIKGATLGFLPTGYAVPAGLHFFAVFLWLPDLQSEKIANLNQTGENTSMRIL